jgi:ribosomal protein L29
MGKYWMYRMFGYGSDEPDTYCDYVRKAKEKLATEVVPRNFRVEISEGQFRQASGVSYYQYQYAQKQLFYEGYGHTIPTFQYGGDRGGEAYYTDPLPSGDHMNRRATCPKDPTLGMFYDLCLELDVLRSQIEELESGLVQVQEVVMDELRAELAKDIPSEVDELRAELVELKKAKDIQSEVDELRAELVELKKAKDIQSEVDELRAELAELKPKQQPKGKFGFFHKQS